MNCQSVQRQILASEHPDRLEPEVERHLAGCPACREVQRSLLRIEAALPTLPIPPSAGPVILFRTLVYPVIDTTGSGRFVPRPPKEQRERSGPRRLRESSRQKLALAFALAASLLVFAIGWWAWPHGHLSVESVRMVRYRHDRDDGFRMARTPRERVETLALLGDALIEEVRLTDDLVRLGELARVYQHLVENDLLAEAARIPTADRSELLHSVANRLSQTESEASRLASEQPHRARQLRVIARSARKGDVRLRALAGPARG
jgi:hypothetical protein